MSAYFVIHNAVHDSQKMQQYIAKAFASLAPYEPEVLVVEESSQVLEGSTPFPRTIVVQFASRERALAWYHSPEYRAALPLRLAATEGFAVLVNGYEPTTK